VSNGTAQQGWTWQMVWAFAIVAAAIVIMFSQSSDPGTRDQLIALFEALVGIIVGAAVGAAVGFYRGIRFTIKQGQTTKDWTWQMVFALGIVAAAIVIMFIQSPDQATRDELVALFEGLVGVIVGAGGGAAVGWHLGLHAGIRQQQRKTSQPFAAQEE